MIVGNNIVKTDLERFLQIESCFSDPDNKKLRVKLN